MQKSESSLSWSSPFETHDYNPLYLANSHFGGTVEVSGTDMSLWSSSIVGADLNGGDNSPLYPVTAIRTRVFYQDTHHKKEQMFLGRSGILTDDPTYTTNPLIPHLPQVYRFHQSLDIEKGIAQTKGTLYTGSQAGLDAQPDDPRAIPFKSTKAFLLGSPYAQFIIESRESVEITFMLESLLEEQFAGAIPGKGIYSWGGMPMNCALHFKQHIVSEKIEQNRIELVIKPEGSDETYTVIAISTQGTAMRFSGSPAFKGTGSLDVRISILRDGLVSDPEVESLSLDAFFAEQSLRWKAIKENAKVQLPTTEKLWQERYETHLFQVVQSIGYGPTHPVGLSKPYVPYWFGSFHDTDTYFCRPLLERGSFALAHQNIDYRQRTFAAAINYAEKLERSGAQYPWQTDPKGTGDNDDIIMNHAIIACEAWYQYTYSQDEAVGRTAVNILSGIFENLVDHIDRDSEQLKLKGYPLPTFSETMKVSRPNEAVIGIRAVCKCILEAEQAGFNVTPEQVELATKIRKDVQLYTHEDGTYKYSALNEPEYMRCPSISLGSFPLRELPADERLEKYFEEELSKILLLFSWLPHQAAIVASQLQLNKGPKSAAEILRQADVHYRNFHTVDEWENRRVGRPPLFVTASGGFCSAIHSLLIAETAPDEWTLFPATPEEWKDTSFENLVLRNGWKVSATMENGEITSFNSVAPDGYKGTEPKFTNAPSLK